MHVENILHKLLETTIHKTRIKTLTIVTETLISTKQMQLTQLGRNLNIKGKERSGIQRINRVLANPYYQNNFIDIYKCICSSIIANQGRPDIIVDWSNLPNSHFTTEDGEHLVLRASLAAEGRSITIYEEVHPKKKENNPKVHKGFLMKLKSILPKECCPCIITDAGFKTPWFKLVVFLGWDYIGRVRGLMKYSDGQKFKPIKTLFKRANSKPKCFGNNVIAKTNPLNTNIYLYKAKPKGRHKYTKKGKIDRNSDSAKYSKRYKEPWVLVSSLKGFKAENKVVKKYKSRMSIEESFRDTKSIEQGLSMNLNKTIKYKRYIVWLLLAALASLIAWIVGYFAEKNNLHHDFQANTYRHKRVLSFFFLGCRIIKRGIKIPINIKNVFNVFLGAWETPNYV